MLYDKEKIIALGLKLGISTNELGRRSKISGPSMHAIEKGRTKNIRASTLLAIAAALGVRLQDIVKIPQKGNKADLSLDAISAFGQLTPENQAAMLAAMQSLAAQQKKKN